MKKIEKQKLLGLLPEISKDNQLIVPVEDDGVVNFRPYEQGVKVNLEVLNTVRPPKEVFFPQSENYLKFYSRRESLQLEPFKDEEGKRNILLGVRPCDVASFDLLDKVFLEDPQDPLYLSRRENTVVIALACSNPAPTCFCTAFQLEPGASPGADVIMHDVDDNFIILAQSDKGKEFLQLIESHLEPASKSDEEVVYEQRQEAASREVAASKEHGWQLEGVHAFLKDKFDWHFWDELYRRCIGCGTCTFLCPTCHCFDVQDFAKNQEGLRFRCWDSCMYGEFTLMASGENPRPTQKERVRNRFLHKLYYYPSRYDGVYACVGCGRCLRKCPVQLDISQVIKEAGGELSGNS